ncbi:hypothetical protein SNEBB_003665 [Seison nebaliae]|nr:hypothetical protein SNEBB_003665 [Seison nebaliae]
MIDEEKNQTLKRSSTTEDKEVGTTLKSKQRRSNNDEIVNENTLELEKNSDDEAEINMKLRRKRPEELNGDYISPDDNEEEEDEDDEEDDTNDQCNDEYHPDIHEEDEDDEDDLDDEEEDELDEEEEEDDEEDNENGIDYNHCGDKCIGLMWNDINDESNSTTEIVDDGDCDDKEE